MRSSSGARHRHVVFEPSDSVTRLTAASFTNAILSPPPSSKKNPNLVQNDQNYTYLFDQKNPKTNSEDPALKSLKKTKKNSSPNKTVNKISFALENKPKAMSQGKFDLMQLGIDLDEDLISRLQDKIGMESILSFVNSASNIVQERRSPLEPGGLRETSVRFSANNSNKNLVPVPSANETISKKSITGQFNSVVYGNQSPQKNKTKSLYNNHPVDSDENNFKIASDLLSRLMNQDPTIIDAKFRQPVLKLIEILSLQYYHNSERFISLFLGQKYTPKRVNRNELNLRIIQWILDRRYVVEYDFKIMISRVISSHYLVLFNNFEDILSIFFHLLCFDKNFYNNNPSVLANNPNNSRYNHSSSSLQDANNKIIKKKVVDLWHFFTLLRVFNQQNRRSFDNKNSLLANDVEFWKKFNQILTTDSTKVDLPIPQRAVPQAYSPNDFRIDPHPNACVGKIKRSISTPKSRNYVHSRPNDTTAQESCRFIYGTMEKERIKDGNETVSVGNALYSNVNSSSKNSSIKFRDILKTEDVLPLNKPSNMLESSSVSYLLNQQDLIQKQKDHYSHKNNSQFAPSVINYSSTSFRIYSPDSPQPSAPMASVLPPPPPN